MSKRKLPAAPRTPQAARGVSFDLPQSALARWNPGLRAASEASGEAATISILDVIGEDYWTGEGMTAKRLAGILRSIGGADVTVHINSPGGDLFEGLAIYNMLREYEGRVTVHVLGVAASAASVIAMAGDDIRIGRAAFFMIHNAWIVASGNKSDLRAAADWIEPFDLAMADIYCARTGLERDEVSAFMDAETWIGGAQAVEQGFADSLLASDEIKEGEGAKASAVRAVDLALAKTGMPRSERRRLLAEIKSTPGAAPTTGKPGAAGQLDASTAASEIFASLLVLDASHVTRI